MAAVRPGLRVLLFGILFSALSSVAAASAACAVELPPAPAELATTLVGPGLQSVASPPFCDRNPNHQLCARADDDRFCEKRLDHPLCDRDRFCSKRPDHPLCDDGQPPSPS
jgi:hypothetical protein